MAGERAELAFQDYLLMQALCAAGITQPMWGNGQAACVSCSAVEHPPSVLQALQYSLLEHR